MGLDLGYKVDVAAILSEILSNFSLSLFKMRWSIVMMEENYSVKLSSVKLF